MESPLSNRGIPQLVPHVPVRFPEKNISALTKEGAGFDVMSFACNHAMDYGEEAFFDTIDLLTKNGITVVGAGKNIKEARKPIVLERKGITVGFLAYLSILSTGLEAEEEFPGCVPLRSSHFYKQWDFQPGTPPIIITQLLSEHRAAMEEDIEQLRPQVNVLVVSHHAGVHFVPAMIAQYQKEAAYAAIDTGADLVLQHHAHILKGIEMYKGKAIFYGLGNFAMEQVKVYAGDRTAGDPDFRRLREIYKVKPIPGYEKYRYHFDALKTIIAKVYIEDKEIQKVTYIPCHITPDIEPEVVGRKDPRAQQVFNYVQEISDSEGLNVHFSWDGDEVLISS
jgi:poly-gamma-glutamate synthesis protein (capsule biosynthesis protein)